MKQYFLLGSVALLFLLALGQLMSFLLKNPERTIAFADKGEGSVAVELVIGKQEQGIFYFSREKRVGDLLSAVNPEWKEDNKTPLTEGMSIRVVHNRVSHIDEMAAQKKLALGIPVDINQLSPAELMLIPGIGKKTASAIHLYIQDKGCIRDMSDLANIRGIKEKKIAHMRKYLIAKPDACGRSLPRT